MNIVKRMLADLRGEPTQCDFCEQPKPLEQLEPEEAGAWVCHECLERWEKQEKAQDAEGKAQPAPEGER